MTLNLLSPLDGRYAEVTAQLSDLGNQPLEIGMPFEMVTRRLRSDGDERGILVYGYKFRPLTQAAN